MGGGGGGGMLDGERSWVFASTALVVCSILRNSYVPHTISLQVINSEE